MHPCYLRNVSFDHIGETTPLYAPRYITRSQAGGRPLDRQLRIEGYHEITSFLKGRALRNDGCISLFWRVVNLILPEHFMSCRASASNV